MSETVKLVLSRCKLDQHYHYLTANGFDTWDRLKLLTKKDSKQLKGIPYGHLLSLIEEIQRFQNEQPVDSQMRPKYQQFLKSLNKIPSPDTYFSMVDKQINRYTELKQQYLDSWTEHQQYHVQITNFLQTTPSGTAPVVTSEHVRTLLSRMQTINASLQQLLQNMGNTNFDVDSTGNQESKEQQGASMGNNSNNSSYDDDTKIETDVNIKPSTAKKQSNPVKRNSKKPPSQWQYDEDKSLRDDVQLYLQSIQLQIEQLSKNDWKSIAKMHNDNFWSDTALKGRSYKDCKAQWDQAPLPETETNKAEINGEMDDPLMDEIEIDQMHQNIPTIQSTLSDRDSSSSDEEDPFGLLNKMEK